MKVAMINATNGRKGIFQAMNFVKLVFLSLVFVLSFVPDTFALTKVGCPVLATVSTDGPGRFKFTDKCYICPEGCYCTGNLAPIDPNDKISGSEVENWCLRNSNSCDGHNSSTWWYTNTDATSNKFELYTYGLSTYKKCPAKKDANCTLVNYSTVSDYACGLSNTAHIFRCPSGYPSSPEESKSINDCYNSSITCPAGRYIGAKSGSCSKICENGYYCPSNTYTNVKYNEEKNKKACPSTSAGFTYHSGTSWSKPGDCKQVKPASKIDNCYSGSVYMTAKLNGSSISWDQHQVSDSLTAKAGYKVDSESSTAYRIYSCKPCGNGYYNDTNGNASGSCTACNTVSGWTAQTINISTKKITDVATSYNQCIITQTPFGCQSGTVKKDYKPIKGVGNIEYTDEISVFEALSAMPGHYVNGTGCTICATGTYYGGGTATSCTPVQDGHCASKDGRTCIASGGKRSRTTGAITQIKCEEGTYSNSDHTLCVACTGADQYVVGERCETCPANSGSGQPVFFKASNGANDGISNCRLAMLARGCVNKYVNKSDNIGYAIVLKYDTNKELYLSDEEYKPYAEVNYYVKDGLCASCESINNKETPYSPGGTKGSEQCYSCDAGSCLVFKNNRYECKECTAGFKCPAKNNAAQMCNANYLDDFNAFGVEICEAGSFSRKKATGCVSCAVGYTTAKVTGRCNVSKDTGVASYSGDGLCCIQQEGGQKGCALTNSTENEDDINKMCTEKGVSLCYISENQAELSCVKGFYWPKGINFSRPDMTVIGKQYYSKDKSDVRTNM